ncbi:hypothetical protein KUTeg_007192 [Tegillarca granosa]|uniref:DOMON domain-containing protein n=1 Tax=Tegillarca granosa TaxID=220873 RepID=A0ABQ9FGP6_TEGGR|nr:hypothetical protein KUTeg_007192 [Tegillarca granosa]
MYINTTLSPEYQLYHRVLKELNEIEVIMRVKSQTWVGLGWRPANLKSGCQYFPNLPGVIPRPEPEPEKSTTKPEPEPHSCGGKVSACPSGQCLAHLMWTFDEKTDVITFQIDAAIEENQWLGLGLSKDTAMVNTDIYTGWYTNGVAYIQDRYASAKREPPIDQTQNIFNISASRNNGRTFLTFSRKRNTGDSSDEAFSDTECLYPLFAWGPVRSLSSLSIGYHSFRYNGVTEKLCIKSCPPQTSTTKPEPEPEKTTITPEPEPEKSTSEPEPEPYLCTGKVSACPSGQCVAHLMWTFDEKTDMITFQIDAAIEENQWLGLGLSKDTAMIKTDIYTGWYTNGVAYIQDRYASAKREPPIDQTQNIFNISASRNNGRTFLTFSRKRNTDDSSDEAFSDTECLYPLFAWGPVTSLSSLSIGYHSFRYNGVTEKLCIKSCSPQTSTTKPVPEPEKTTIAPAPEPEKSTTKPEPEPSLCTGKVSACPSGQCVAHLMWTFDEKTDMITFQIDAAIEENQWLGLGLSKDTSMTNTDIYTGWYTNGVTNVQDRYASAKREPPIDAIQNIFNVSGKRVNGRTFLTFSRQRNTGDSSDEIFSDTQCLYPLFAWGPVTSFSSRTIGYHAFRYNGVTEKLCIKSCSNVSPEPEKPTSEPETTGEPEGEGEPGSCGAPPRGFNDTTGDSPHPMDCVDMVIGSAKGQLSRIGDYYSRDRSTPQKDEFYGGKDDLTAAYGFEDSNGYTTIMFRKKLRADERSDFSFLNEYMHVIWARGQEPGKFHHLPNVGLAENELSSFYKHDELKYHGHGGQRGIRRINFLDEPSGPVVGNCTQTWRNPSDNTHEVTWQYDSTTDSVQFTLKARLLQRQWIGVGISRDTFMPNTDTIVGWVNDDKTVTLIDGWASGRSVPATDTVQDVQGVRGTIENGITTISFNRRRDTQDQNDIAFSQNECVHLIYAKGGDYAVETGRFGYHDTTPIVSSGKICIPCPTVNMLTDLHMENQK